MHTVIDIESLSQDERELIRAAVGNRGLLEIITKAETHGRAVVAGRRKFFDAHNPAAAAHFLTLLGHLKELELIHEATNRKAYELTNFGWQVSRKLGRP
jgi:hypothetical protein